MEGTIDFHDLIPCAIACEATDVFEDTAAFNTTKEKVFMDTTELAKKLGELDRLYVQKMDSYRARQMGDDSLEKKHNILKEQIESAYPGMKVVCMVHALVPDTSS